jgi:hypothetical protein
MRVQGSKTYSKTGKIGICTIGNLNLRRAWFHSLQCLNISVQNIETEVKSKFSTPNAKNAFTLYTVITKQPEAAVMAINNYIWCAENGTYAYNSVTCFIYKTG